ncbi:isopeptide-forming domain-containing fimbrial protein [Terrisporobacter glycolicus]|nr:isopeptide-forming domain-containing fimbrial protein [Terrisporobacter glycolicus]
MLSNSISFTADKSSNIPIIVGNTATFSLSIKNLSSDTRYYNLSLFLTLPDGMTLSTSTVTQTSSITNSDNSTTYSWINLKDLAPMEVNYTFGITVKCNTKYKNGTTIPFGTTFSGINMSCQLDTQPRGNYDIFNEKITKEILMSFLTVKFTGTVSTSGKVLKGAGTSIDLNDYSQITSATCKIYNNSVSSSYVNITILLDDGIRYIGNISTSGTDASLLKNPTISFVNINNKTYTQLYFGGVNLSISSNTTLTFYYAVWNRYNNNQGYLITHGTNLNMSISVDSADPLIISSSNNNTSFTAMDLIITTSTSKSSVDVQNTVTYTYVYKVGQYYNIQDIVVHYYLPDGVFYISSSSTPTSIVDNAELKGYYITYNFPLATINSSKTVTINAKIDSYYRYKYDNIHMNLPVVAFDNFIGATDISGNIYELSSNVTDNASVASSVSVGSITKQFVKGYYRNGVEKTISPLAPGDLAAYKLTYNASTLKAIQKQVYIDDFFPLSADPINNLTYTYSGITPIASPQLIEPHGVDFYYGDLAGLSSGTIDFMVPIKSLGTSTQNANLMKLKGINTYGYAYSNRAQVTINIGKPNLTLTKSVTGSNKTAIQSGETYYYIVTLTNTNSLGTETDAFDFALSDTLSSWFTLDQSSIKVISTGSYNNAQVQGNNISIYINKLAPGQSLTLTYSVKISSAMAPGVSITTTASNTNPYSQVYDGSLDNFQFTNLNKSASVTISSSSINLTKSTSTSLIRVGSLVTYTVNINVPLGTIAYELYLKDTLPSGGQIYVGPSYRNGTIVTPVVSSNIITYPNEGTVDARLSSQTLTYVLISKVSNANKSVNGITSSQTNTVQCYYKQIQGGSYTNISKGLSITINHPNLVMNLMATDKTNSIIYTQSANIATNSIMEFRLDFKNNSSIKLINGTIEIPINNGFLFSSINNTSLCSATYNNASNKVIITIPNLDSLMYGYITYTVYPQPILTSGTIINTQATAISYYNDLSVTKVYGGEKSNILTCTLAPGVSLLPDPITMINESTSYIVTPPGGTATINNYFKNTGGGYDSFTIIIQKVSIPYTLYIDDIKIEDISANTYYESDLDTMKNLAKNTSKTITIIATPPMGQSLGSRYDFIITVKSKTSPYPEKTVLNIDPS